MCLMITKPAGVSIKKEHLEKAFDNNSHGAGFALATGSKVKTIKPFFKFDDFYREYSAYEKLGVPMLIHFRLATHGSKTAANTHPHQICRTLAMAHNGVISKVKVQGDESDTRAFIRENITPIVKPVGRQGYAFPDDIAAALTDEKLKEYDDLIGASKLAFLTASGQFYHVNKKAGHDHDGCWWSNDSYKRDRYFSQAYDHSERHYYGGYQGAHYDKQLVFCCGCGFANQRRHTVRCWIKPDYHGTSLLRSGFDAHFCKTCMAKHNLLEPMGTVAYMTTVPEPFAKNVERETKNMNWLKHMNKRADNASRTMGYTNWEVDCSFCGRRHPRGTAQGFLPPLGGQHGVAQKYACPFCVVKLGRSVYNPDRPVQLHEKSPEWEQLNQVASWAASVQKDYQDKVDEQRARDAAARAEASPTTDREKILSLIAKSRKMFYTTPNGTYTYNLRDLHIAEQVEPKPNLGRLVYNSVGPGCVLCMQHTLVTNEMHLCISCSPKFVYKECSPAGYDGGQRTPPNQHTGTVSVGSTAITVKKEDGTTETLVVAPDKQDTTAPAAIIGDKSRPRHDHLETKSEEVVPATVEPSVVEIGGMEFLETEGGLHALPGQQGWEDRQAMRKRIEQSLA